MSGILVYRNINAFNESFMQSAKHAQDQDAVVPEDPAKLTIRIEREFGKQIGLQTHMFHNAGQKLMKQVSEGPEQIRLNGYDYEGNPIFSHELITNLLVRNQEGCIKLPLFTRIGNVFFTIAKQQLFEKEVGNYLSFCSDAAAVNPEITHSLKTIQLCNLTPHKAEMDPTTKAFVTTESLFIAPETLLAAIKIKREDDTYFTIPLFKQAGSLSLEVVDSCSLNEKTGIINQELRRDLKKNAQEITQEMRDQLNTKAEFALDIAAPQEKPKKSLNQMREHFTELMSPSSILQKYASSKPLSIHQEHWLSLETHLKMTILSKGKTEKGSYPAIVVLSTIPKGNPTLCHLKLSVGNQTLGKPGTIIPLEEYLNEPGQYIRGYKMESLLTDKEKSQFLIHQRSGACLIPAEENEPVHFEFQSAHCEDKKLTTLVIIASSIGTSAYLVSGQNKETLYHNKQGKACTFVLEALKKIRDDIGRLSVPNQLDAAEEENWKIHIIHVPVVCVDPEPVLTHVLPSAMPSPSLRGITGATPVAYRASPALKPIYRGLMFAEIAPSSPIPQVKGPSSVPLATRGGAPASLPATNELHKSADTTNTKGLLVQESDQGSKTFDSEDLLPSPFIGQIKAGDEVGTFSEGKGQTIRRRPNENICVDTISFYHVSRDLDEEEIIKIIGQIK